MASTYSQEHNYRNYDKIKEQDESLPATNTEQEIIKKQIGEKVNSTKSPLPAVKIKKHVHYPHLNEAQPTVDYVKADSLQKNRDNSSGIRDVKKKTLTV